MYIIIFFMCMIRYVLPLYPFQNMSLPFDERVNDLVGRLTTDEMVVQMAIGGASTTPAIQRLGIGKIQWSTECLRGDVGAENATSYPQAIGLSASFNPSLIYEVAEATSVEVRAKHNDYVSKGIYRDHTGLSCFSPVINIMRHPLWGRSQETYGEDPYLTGILTEHFVKGLQGSHPRYRRANAVCKHFDAYGGPEDVPEPRLKFNAVVPERDLRTTFLPQFKACVDAGAVGIMCSYNSVNGIPACANRHLLTDILREEWGFQGFVISDSGAVESVMTGHYYTHDVLSTAVACVKAGLNLELSPVTYNNHVYMFLGMALEAGSITKQLLIDRVKPLFHARMRLGEFDLPDVNPYTKLNLSVIQSDKHQQLSVKAAVQSFVLLKNLGGYLPLRSKPDTIAIVGPMADNPTQIMGDYAPDVDPHFMRTPRDGLSSLAAKTHFASGCRDSDPQCHVYDSLSVKLAVMKANVTFLCLGTGQIVESENLDRYNLSLPGKQEQLLEDVIQHASGPVVLLLFSAGPVDIRKAASSSKVKAIIQCFFPAQSAGIALADAITLATPGSNPAGRLPYTWYADMSQVTSMTNYSMINKTYRYFHGDPLYPFGYGLSYTTFQYSGLVINPERVKIGNNVTVTFRITNTGPVDGDEVGQVYISWQNATVPTPKFQIAGFNRYSIAKGQTTACSFNITSQQMAVWVDGKGFVIQPGEINVYAGGQLPGQKATVPSNILQGHFNIYS